MFGDFSVLSYGPKHEGSWRAVSCSWISLRIILVDQASDSATKSIQTLVASHRVSLPFPESDFDPSYRCFSTASK